MGDRLPRVKVAAVQAAPVFLDREATVEKACRLMEEAGRAGAQVVAFPEGFVPGHPLWYHFHPATGDRSREYAARLFANAVTVPGPETEALGDVCKRIGAWAVVGVCEKERGTTGTLYNSLVFLSPRGRVEHVHRKLTPTVGERLVHAPGLPVGLRVLDTEVGRLSGLICGENSNPLAVFVLLSQHTMIHVASWPNLPGRGMLPRSERALLAGRAFAFTAKAFVVNACGTVDDRMREMLAYTDEDRAFLARSELVGGSSVVGPSGEVVAGPLGPEEAVLYAEVDLERCVYERTVHDFAGHYNRPDVFELRVRSRPPQMVRWVEEGRTADGGQAAPAVWDAEHIEEVTERSRT
jgi:nitrilase